MIDCRKCIEYIEAAGLGTAGRDDLALVEEHVSVCESCRREYDTRRLIGEAVQEAFKTETADCEGRERVLARVRTSREAPARARADRRMSWRAAAAALAAGFVLGAIITGFSGEIRQTVARIGGEGTSLRVVEASGTVLMRREGARQWRPVAEKARLWKGDEIITSVGSDLVLSWIDESVLKVAGGSQLGVKASNGVTELELSHGRMRASLSAPHPLFSVITPQGRIRALGTDFTVSVE